MFIDKKNIYLLSIFIVLIIIIYLLYKKNNNKNSNYVNLEDIKLYKQEDSRIKFPKWLKIGSCRPCVGSPSSGCCNGCLCAKRS